jgi:peptidoglycan hydrolase CwlO-like protein
VVSLVTPIFADDINDQIEAKKREIQELQAKLDQVQGQKKTLQTTLSYLDNKIKLTATQIQETEAEKKQLEVDISLLSYKIGQLDISLTQITTILLHRVADTYKESRANPYFATIASNSLSGILSQFKYLQETQKNDRHLIYALESTRIDYDSQKSSKETKQQQLNVLSDKLQQQKRTLSIQQQSKQQLLEVTKNDEKKYQQLLAQAIAQKNAFERFINNQGGASILNNQTVCNDWGCYYNQRDSQWGNLPLGTSDSSVAAFGCLITSISMVASHQKIGIKPSDIAFNPNAFFNDTGYLLHDFDAGGKHVHIDSKGASYLDSELAKGPVVVGLYSGPDHFIVIKEKKDGNYIMNDPFLENGHDKSFTDKYSVSNINSLRVVTFN